MWPAHGAPGTSAESRLSCRFPFTNWKNISRASPRSWKPAWLHKNMCILMPAKMSKINRMVEFQPQTEVDKFINRKMWCSFSEQNVIFRNFFLEQCLSLIFDGQEAILHLTAGSQEITKSFHLCFSLPALWPQGLHNLGQLILPLSLQIFEGEEGSLEQGVLWPHEI